MLTGRCSLTELSQLAARVGYRIGPEVGGWII
jgi:hypothetical protein